jgi:hypothetical protein
MLAGMTADMTAESIALGLATAWNPIAIGANLGFELLTSTPLWLGGGYVFGVALYPVRVEARASETVHGYSIWQAMDQSAYAWGALKKLPEEVRDKKEPPARAQKAIRPLSTQVSSSPFSDKSESERSALRS